jgi:5-(carboxyamino)imidazole ribonucleotide mutase
MPAGIPVATVAIGNAANAGLLAARIIGAADLAIAEKLEVYAESLKDKVAQMNLEIKL